MSKQREMSRELLDTFWSSAVVGGARVSYLVSIHSYDQCPSSCGCERSVSLLLFALCLVKMYAAIENIATCEVRSIICIHWQTITNQLKSIGDFAKFMGIE